MMARRFLPMVASGVLFFSAGQASAREAAHLTLESFDRVAEVIAENIKTYGAGRVLVALDIDNTTLATYRDIGSEHWVLWQLKLIEDGRFNDGAVAYDFPALLTLQSLILHQSRMTAVEPRIPQDLERLGRMGVKMLALTSRDRSQHDATERELARNGFPYKSYAPGPEYGYAGTFKPYDLTRLADSGLTDKDVKTFGLGKPADVTYENGIFLTAGQHKGIMLRTLLAKTKTDFDAIVFIDDRLKHSQGMQAAFADLPVNVTTVQYTHTAAHARDFEASDKAEVKSDWCEFARGLTAIQAQEPMVPFIPCH